MNIAAVFQLQRLFEMQPTSTFKFGIWLLLFFGIQTALLFFLLIISKFIVVPKELIVRKREIQKIIRFFVITALTGLVLVIARVQYIALFSMRFFLLALILIEAAMMVYFFLEWFYFFSTYEKNYLQEITRQKYLPKRKK